MKQITKEQIDFAINRLAEAPAKYVFDVIVMLQNLSDVEQKEDDKNR